MCKIKDFFESSIVSVKNSISNARHRGAEDLKKMVRKDSEHLFQSKEN